MGGKNNDARLCKTVGDLVGRINKLLPYACDLTAEHPFGRVTDRRTELWAWLFNGCEGGRIDSGLHRRVSETPIQLYVRPSCAT